MTDPVMLLSQLHGEGRVTFRAVRAAGFYTLASIAEASAQTLSDRAHLSLTTARRLKTGADELIGKGVGLAGPEADTPGSEGGVRRLVKNGRRKASEDPPFSEGVSIEEAMLLAPDDPGAREEAHPEAATAAEDPLPPLARPELGNAAAGLMAAAAEAAAELARAGTDPPAAAGAADPPKPGRTFWIFG